jgi:hypothetical protein
MSRLSLAVALIASSPVFACTCVWDHAQFVAAQERKAAGLDGSVDFRGTVVERITLPEHPQMRGRKRYATTFKVDEYWLGSPERRVTLYTMGGGTDCYGDPGYVVGKNYLVFASEVPAKDAILDKFFWYGWTDVLTAGSKMLEPTACTYGGETSKVQPQLLKLGPGKPPQK